MKVFLGFDFYGAGNVGDDLMLAGFLDVASEYLPAQFICIIPYNVISQQLRFPMVQWMSASKAVRNEIISTCDAWVGVGDTPFQLIGGKCYINKFVQEIKLIKGLKNYLIGVGAEHNFINEREIINIFLNSIRHVWTRDDTTANILINDLEYSQGKVTIGSDLANIILQSIFSEIVNSNINRPYKLGVSFYVEKLCNNDIAQLKKFLVNFSKEGSVLFFANETRKYKYFEHGIYNKMFGGLKSLLKKPFVEYYAPDYNSVNIKGLVGHFKDIEVVMSSRYHVLLAAAWAGCKITALSRSSKIDTLTRELDISIVHYPFTVDKLMKGYYKAKNIKKSLLERKANIAKSSINDFLTKIKNEI
jgi:hypothetical protein